MLERSRKDLPLRTKQEVALARIVVKMKEDEEKTIQGTLVRPPTTAQIRGAEESGTIPCYYKRLGIQMVGEKLHPILDNDDF